MNACNFRKFFQLCARYRASAKQPFSGTLSDLKTMGPRKGSKEALILYELTLTRKDKGIESLWAQALELYDDVNKSRKQGKFHCETYRELERAYIKDGPSWDTIPNNKQFLQDLVSVKYLKTTPRANYGSMVTANTRSKEQFSQIRAKVGEAFAKIKADDYKSAIKIVSDSIWGYGPVTATLLLSFVAPDRIMFCCDQVLDVANSGMDRKYAIQECLNAIENLKTFRDVINNVRGDEFWTMEMCGKAVYVMGILHGELHDMKSLPPKLSVLLNKTNAMIATNEATKPEATKAISASGVKRKRVDPA